MKKNQNTEKIGFKVVQMKSFAMHVTNHKLSFDIFMVGKLQNIFMEHDFYLIPNDFWHKRKIDHFDPYNVLLAIATNILMTGFVVQGHISVILLNLVCYLSYLCNCPWNLLAIYEWKLFLRQFIFNVQRIVLSNLSLMQCSCHSSRWVLYGN